MTPSTVTMMLLLLLMMMVMRFQCCSEQWSALRDWGYNPELDNDSDDDHDDDNDDDDDDVVSEPAANS